MAIEVTRLLLDVGIFLVLAWLVYAVSRKSPPTEKTKIFNFPKPAKDPLKPVYLSDQEAYELERKEKEEGQ